MFLREVVIYFHQVKPITHSLTVPHNHDLRQYEALPPSIYTLLVIEIVDHKLTIICDKRPRVRAHHETVRNETPGVYWINYELGGDN
jgi:hypothetical protein